MTKPIPAIPTSCDAVMNDSHIKIRTIKITVI
jgi:hypothetical protein